MNNTNATNIQVSKDFKQFRVKDNTWGNWTDILKLHNMVRLEKILIKPVNETVSIILQTAKDFNENEIFLGNLKFRIQMKDNKQKYLIIDEDEFAVKRIFKNRIHCTSNYDNGKRFTKYQAKYTIHSIIKEEAYNAIEI